MTGQRKCIHVKPNGKPKEQQSDARLKGAVEKAPSKRKRLGHGKARLASSSVTSSMAMGYDFYITPHTML